MYWCSPRFFLLHFKNWYIHSSKNDGLWWISGSWAEESKMEESWRHQLKFWEAPWVIGWQLLSQFYIHLILLMCWNAARLQYMTSFMHWKKWKMTATSTFSKCQYYNFLSWRIDSMPSLFDLPDNCHPHNLLFIYFLNKFNVVLTSWSGSQALRWAFDMYRRHYSTDNRLYIQC